MTRPKTKFPISSFGPELMAALTQGGQRRLELSFPNRRMASAFQHRCNTLRSKMREEQHPDYLIAARAKVSVLWGARLSAEFTDDPKGERGARVVITPRDSEYGSILKDAGVVLPTLESDPLTDAEPAVGGGESTAPLPYDAFLSSLSKIEVKK